MILVTGATGFLGRQLVQQALRHGHAVRALVRRPVADLALPDGPSCEVCQGDLTDPVTLDAAVAGVETVVHAAATTSEMAPDEALSQPGRPHLRFGRRRRIVGRIGTASQLVDEEQIEVGGVAELAATQFSQRDHRHGRLHSRRGHLLLDHLPGR